MTERYRAALRDHIHASAPQMMREPAGRLERPYIVPSSPDSPYYSVHLWDWDSWLTSVALGQVELETEAGRFLRYEQGAVLNFLDHTSEEGVMPVQMSPESELRHGDFASEAEYARGQNMHKPVIVQHAALLARRAGDAEWLRPHL